MDENTTQSPENATKEKFLGFVKDAMLQALREGRPVPQGNPDQNPIVKSLLEGMGPGAIGSQAAPGPRSLGGVVVGSDEFKAYHAKQMKGVSGQIDFGGLSAMRQTAGVADLADVLTTLSTERLGSITALPMRSLHVIDLLNTRTTTGGSVEFVQQTGFTSNAAAIARNVSDPSTVTSVSQGTITVDTVTRPVATVEAYIPIPRTMFEDTPAMTGLIESQLAEGLLDALDTEILAGTGISPHMKGITAETGCQTYAWSAGTAGDNQADAIGRAIAQAAVAKYVCDGIVMHPTDAWNLRLLKDSTGRYHFPQALSGGMPVVTLWGLPVAETAQITVNYSLVGAFRRAADYYERQEGRVQFLDQHSDWALKGLYCALATLRGVVVTYRPENFVYAHLDAAPTP